LIKRAELCRENDWKTVFATKEREDTINDALPSTISYCITMRTKKIIVAMRLSSIYAKAPLETWRN